MSVVGGVHAGPRGILANQVADAGARQVDQPRRGGAADAARATGERLDDACLMGMAAGRRAASQCDGDTDQRDDPRPPPLSQTAGADPPATGFRLHGRTNSNPRWSISWVRRRACDTGRRSVQLAREARFGTRRGRW